ncbi:MAG: TadE/TadG family type IV pilus assembly protein [Thermodesulfovibrionales bacterium]
MHPTVRLSVRPALRLGKESAGVAAVEFALVLPLLVLLAFGIVEFGLVLYNKAVITNASREGARAGVVFKVPAVTVDDIETVVTAYCGDHLVSLGATANPTSAVVGSCDAAGSALTVTVTYPHTFLVIPDIATSFFSGDIPGALTLQGVTVMRCENI